MLNLLSEYFGLIKNVLEVQAVVAISDVTIVVSRTGRIEREAMECGLVPDTARTVKLMGCRRTHMSHRSVHSGLMDKPSAKN